MSSPTKSSNDEGWEEEDTSLLTPTSRPEFWRQKFARSWAKTLSWALVLLSGLLNILFVIIIAHLLSSRVLPQDCPCIKESYSPAEGVVEYIPMNFQRGFGKGKDVSPYQGWPNDEQDQLWEDMYSQGASIHINEAEYKHIKNTTERIPIPGYENDYLVGIDVFHQLHCLNMIRMAFYPGRYNMTFKRKDGTVDYTVWMHIDHCIESLRMSLTCHSDISPFTFRWIEHLQMIEPEISSFHVCRNFSKIRQWAFERHIDVDNRQSRVLPDGRIVDYSRLRPNPEGAADLGEPPAWWRYNPDDL